MSQYWTPLTVQLVNKLKTLKVWSLTTNKKEISLRCPICGDSYKHANSSHLYIKLDVNEGEPHTYYCQRCKAKGIVTADFLKLLKIHDSELNVAIGINLKEASKNNNRKVSKRLNKADLIVPNIYNVDKRNLIKLKYINDRLGIKLGFDDLAKFKIFLNLYDVLDLNEINFLTCRQGMEDILNDNFIGFISYDNNYAIMRNLSKKVLPETRYYNYNIYDNYDNTKRFYIIPTKIDIMSPTIKICIAEGIMDILGVYHHLEKEHNNTLFIAVCGTGYNLVINEIAKMGFLDMDIKFYSDNDQDLRMFRKIKSEFSFLSNKRCEVIYNTIEKDFGVTADKIKIKKSFI